MISGDEAAPASGLRSEEFPLQNKSPPSCPPCPPGTPPGPTAPPAAPPPSPTHVQAFNLNRNHVLCLPVFCSDDKLAWVHSAAVAQEVAHVAHILYGAFAAFPYPTPEETAALARRCSLHVDRVRVWFMFQRLRYGVSWDCGDVREIRERLRRPARAGEDDRQGVREEEGEEEEEEGEGETETETEKTPGRPRKRKRGEGKAKGKTSEKRERGENIFTPGQKRPQPAEERNGLPHGVRPKRVQRGPGDRARVSRSHAGGGPGRAGTASPAPPREREPASESAATPLAAPPVGRTSRRRRQKRTAPSDPPPRDQVGRSAPEGAGPPAGKGRPGPTGARTGSAPIGATTTATRGEAPRPKSKTGAQVDALRRAFLARQYPDRREYGRLAAQTGLRRADLVQWFSDTRYYVKNGQPRWLAPEEWRRIAGHFRRRQRAKAPATRRGHRRPRARQGPGGPEDGAGGGVPSITPVH